MERFAETAWTIRNNQGFLYLLIFAPSFSSFPSHNLPWGQAPTVHKDHLRVNAAVQCYFPVGITSFFAVHVPSPDVNQYPAYPPPVWCSSDNFLVMAMSMEWLQSTPLKLFFEFDTSSPCPLGLGFHESALPSPRDEKATCFSAAPDRHGCLHFGILVINEMTIMDVCISEFW